MYQKSFVSKLDHEMHRIFSIEPNDLNNRYLTNFYKIFTKPLKSIPLIYIIPLSIILSITIYFVFGQMLIKIVTLLQNGF